VFRQTLHDGLVIFSNNSKKKCNVLNQCYFVSDNGNFDYMTKDNECITKFMLWLLLMSLEIDIYFLAIYVQNAKYFGQNSICIFY